MAGGVEEAGSWANRGRNFALVPLHYTTLHITVGWMVHYGTLHHICCMFHYIALVITLHYIVLHWIAQVPIGWMAHHITYYIFSFALSGSVVCLIMLRYITLHYILPWSGLVGCPITGRLPKPRARHAPRIVSPSSSHLPASFSPQAHHSQFWGVSKSRDVSTFHILTYTPSVLDRQIRRLWI